MSQRYRKIHIKQAVGAALCLKYSYIGMAGFGQLISDFGTLNLPFNITFRYRQNYCFCEMYRPVYMEVF